MDKMKMCTQDIADENFRKLAELFPNAVTETMDENGEVVRAIDKDILMQEISATVVDGPEERYQFTWPDKRKAIRLASSPIAATLRPCREESVDFDKTENLYIEGDNLDVLKLLRETYLGKVKMIYIDPPYNTGNDFVYNDDFSVGSDEWVVSNGDYDEQGNRLVQNFDSNGRFHTDWLNMMYSRLRIARELLKDDGVIFVHIDDNEVENLGKICNEIFGEKNFINIVTVKTKIGGVSGSSEGKSLKDATEFVWIYAKNKSELLFNPVYIKTKLSDRIKNYEIEGKSWKYTSIITKLEDKVLIKEDKVRGFSYYGYKTLETMSIVAFAQDKGMTAEQVYDAYADRIFRTTNAQSSVRKTVIHETAGHNYPIYGCEYIPIKGKNEGNSIEILYKSGATDDQRNMVMFLSDVVEKIDGIYYYMDKVSSLWDDIDYNNLTKEGAIEFPNGKKPIKLLQRLLALSTDKDSIIMDFFSGSASTAHAVMQQNIEDGGNRKFIMVQLPEVCEDGSEAKKAGYNNICEIGKERIRRAGKKVVSDKWEVISKEEKARYGCKELSRADCLAEINGTCEGDLFAGQKTSEDGAVCAVRSDEAGGGLNSIQHSGGASSQFNPGVSAISGDSTGEQSGTGNTTSAECGSKPPCPHGYFGSAATAAGSGENAPCAFKNTIHCPLTAKHSPDIGFRVLKLDSTNMADVYYNPAETSQDDLLNRISNIKTDRTPEDLLFQVMLELGIVLSSKIEETTIGGKKVFNVADNFLIACFDDNVTDETVTAIAKQKPVYAVLRDSSFATDSVAANFEQIFATYSPDTVRRVL